MKEIWKKVEINNIYDYYISNLGNVKAAKKFVTYLDGRTRFYPEKLLKPRKDPKGYYFVSLYGDKYSEQHRVHQLVGKAFIPNPENKFCINHKDGNRINNVIDNLEWVTHKENILDGIKRGTIFKPNKKISEKQVNEIRELYSKKSFTQKQIAFKFGLKQAQISRITSFKNWA